MDEVTGYQEIYDTVDYDSLIVNETGEGKWGDYCQSPIWWINDTEADIFDWQTKTWEEPNPHVVKPC